MIKAVIYARYSSDKQREESIEAQIRAVNDYALKNRLEIVKIYSDEAKSATTDDRPSFQEMIKDSALGIFDVVIVHKLDRFARNRYDSAIYKRRLRENGIQLISVSEQLDGSPESVILESVLEGMAEYYSKNLAREVMKGMKENAYQCKHSGGISPIGFKFNEDQTYGIDEKAEIVQLIFNLYGKGYSYNKIIETLNENGYTSSKGNEFSRATIYEIIKNEKYKGTFVFNKISSKLPNGKRNSHRKKPNNEIIKIENGTPAIVDESVWNQAQLRMSKSPNGTNSAKNQYLLSGLIRCGSCGSVMKGNCLRYKYEAYLYYRCSGHCGVKQVKAEKLEELVINLLSREIKEIKELSFTDKKYLVTKNINKITVVDNSVKIEFSMSSADNEGASPSKVIVHENLS